MLMFMYCQVLPCCTFKKYFRLDGREKKGPSLQLLPYILRLQNFQPEIADCAAISFFMIHIPSLTMKKVNREWCVFFQPEQRRSLWNAKLFPVVHPFDVLEEDAGKDDILWLASTRVSDVPDQQKLNRFGAECCAMLCDVKANPLSVKKSGKSCQTGFYFEFYWLLIVWEYKIFPWLAAAIFYANFAQVFRDSYRPLFRDVTQRSQTRRRPLKTCTQKQKKCIPVCSSQK